MDFISAFLKEFFYYPGLIFVALSNGLISRFLLSIWIHNFYKYNYVELKFKFSIRGSFIIGLFSYFLVILANELYMFFPLNKEVVVSDYFFFLFFCTFVSLFIERRNIFYRKNK